MLVSDIVLYSNVRIILYKVHMLDSYTATLILYSMLTRCSIIINTTGGMRDYLVEFISSVCCSMQLIYNAKNASASLCLFPNRTWMYTTTRTVKRRCCYGNAHNPSCRDSTTAVNQSEESSTVYWSRTPSNTPKMVAKIQSDEFVDMSELLPDRLGCPKTGHTFEDQAIPRPRRRYVSTILEWIQCFGIYIAALTQKHPERIPDLLGYQQLIIEASLEYEGDNWLGYDRQFQLTAAATQNTAWGHIDQTLWSLAFSAKAKASRCKYCFSIIHTAAECAWAPEQLTSNPVTQPMLLFSQRHPPPVCFKWNSAPGRCPVSGCRYNHICLYCANNPNVFDKRHKGIHCPHYSAGQ